MPCRTTYASLMPLNTFCLFWRRGARNTAWLVQVEPATNTVCVLAVPGDMGIGDFCQFLSAYMPHITSMRMVRRENVAKSTCMSAIEFQDAKHAHSFVHDFNGVPFCALEPEIICRVVFLSAIEMHNPEIESAAPSADAVTGTGAAVKAPPGHIELPTCPVCLERLDTHVSGVVTTVRPSDSSHHDAIMTHMMHILIASYTCCSSWAKHECSDLDASQSDQCKTLPF